MTKRAQTTSPVLVDESDLSRAWAKAVLHVLDHPGLEISPLILSVSGRANGVNLQCLRQRPFSDGRSDGKVDGDCEEAL